MQRDALQEHVFGTYLSLRFGMAIIATGFPALIYLIGAFHCIPLQDSLSAYYWADGFKAAPVRVWFVGGLFSLATFFYLYKGFTVGENIALNFAGIFAIGVATMPMDWQCQSCSQNFSVHGTSAVLLFACLAYVVLFRSLDTLKYLPRDENAPEGRHEKIIVRYKRTYRALGMLMLASPLVAFTLNAVFGGKGTIVFFVEAAGVWAFAAYWWVKSYEMRLSKVTRRALRGEIAS